MKTACRGCDGSKWSIKKDEDGIVVSKKTCSRCHGSGEEPGPPKSDKKPRFFAKPKQDDEELSLSQQADAFLAARGFGLAKKRGFLSLFGGQIGRASCRERVFSQV